VSPGHDERRPGEGRRVVEQTGEVEAKSRPYRRQKPAATHVLAECASVIGGTGRQRTLLIYRCPFEGGVQHVAHDRDDLPAVLERPSACRRGQLALHPIVKAVAA